MKDLDDMEDSMALLGIEWQEQSSCSEVIAKEDRKVEMN